MNELARLTFFALSMASLVLFATGCNGEHEESDTPINGEEENGEEENGGEENGGEENGEEENGEEENGPAGVQGRLESLGGGTVLRLWGEPGDRGYAEGALLCEEVTELIEDFVLGHVVRWSGYDYGALRDQVLSQTEYDSADLTWMQALISGIKDHCPAEAIIIESTYLEADSGGSRELEIEDLVVANTLADWACSSFSAWGDATESGSLIHARNLDYIVDAQGTIQRSQIVKLIHAEDRSAKYLSVSWPGMLGCISCVADDASLIMVHDSNGFAPSSTTGLVPRQIAMREGLLAAREASDPVEAAREVLEGLPQYRGNNFHLAATRGNTTYAAVLEYDGDATHDDGQTTVRTVEDNQGTPQTEDALVCTNHYRKRRAPSSCTRYDGLSDGLDLAASGDRIDVPAALDLIHTVAFQGTTQTVHTVILDESTNEVHIHIARKPGVPATTVEPLVIDLGTAFDADL